MIFLSNKYSRCYFNIIENAKSSVRDCQTERHHIIPKSLGGSNEKSNIVKLTLREHFVCHQLLTRMTEGVARGKMAFALRSMLNLTNKKQNRNFRVTSRVFASSKTKQPKTKSSYQSGIHHPFSTKIILNEIEYGSILEASKALKISRHLVKKQCKIIDYRYNFTCNKITSGSFKSGKDHPRAINITINGQKFGSIHEASRILQIPRHHIKLLLAGKTTLRGGQAILA